MYKTCVISSVSGLPFVNRTPSVTFDQGSATVTWQAWNTSSEDRGAGPVIAYIVYYSLVSPISWIAAGDVPVTDPSQSLYSLIVQQLDPNTEYMFSVAAVGDGTGEGPRSPAISGLTLLLPSTSSHSTEAYLFTLTESMFKH